MQKRRATRLLRQAISSTRYFPRVPTIFAVCASLRLEKLGFDRWSQGVIFRALTHVVSRCTGISIQVFGSPEWDCCPKEVGPSIKPYRPFAWLKNTNRLQCSSQLRCCSCSRGGALANSMQPFSSRIKIKAPSQLATRIYDIKTPSKKRPRPQHHKKT